MTIYTRFAPSPTGYLHLGNLRTALFNALFAYHHKGRFLLRIEDTDAARSTKEFAEGIANDLSQLGLTWDAYQKNHVVFQSERYPIYKRYYQTLEAMGAAYPCFCTEERLAQLREKQRLSHQPPGYDGHCRSLPLEAIEARKAQGESFHLRFHVPEAKTIHFKDLLKGHQQFKSEYFYDFVIQRSDKSPAFICCNAIDDALMGVTHVLRGEDHLTNTAKQLLILQTLGLKAPSYGHLPLISQQLTGTPLSKRENSFSLKSLILQGYLPEAIINYLARLGHTITSDQLMSVEELSRVFTLERIHASSAHFDIHQLNFWQKQAIRQLPKNALWDLLNLKLKEKVPLASREYFIETMQSMITFPKEIEYWIHVLFLDPLAYTVESIAAIQSADSMLWKKLLNVLNDKIITGNDALLLKEIKHCLTLSSDKAQHKVHWKALRAALTNTFFGPDILSLIRLLGVSRSIQRIQAAVVLPVSKL